jgi:hypothetical protein
LPLCRDALLEVPVFALAFLETGTGSLLLRRRMDSGLDGWTPFFLNEMVSTKIVFSESVWWILDCSDLFEWCTSLRGVSAHPLILH